MEQHLSDPTGSLTIWVLLVELPVLPLIHSHFRLGEEVMVPELEIEFLKRRRNCVTIGFKGVVALEINVGICIPGL